MTPVVPHPFVTARGKRSIREIAAEAGLSVQGLALIESGAVERPQFETLRKFAKVTGVDYRDLERDVFEWHQARKAAA